ncbi:AMP-binding protein [Corynebacterium lizhenjunii]|uniref:AMP-binding protein n=1 Tax=Corynebacterium lizhenjunii TaxID=2709394 RepID=A0A7T0PBE7_9CORY|nr:AMP-binding protein [Corynebacterium lizhenjunii]QPK79365.1 AMP-binding protein [Corynebacterium lizhenjunii]
MNLAQLRRLPFHAKTAGQLARTLLSSGIIGPQGGPKAIAALPAVLARYRFTTARELEQGALTCPQRVALIDDDGQLTYQELRDHARAFAKYLQQHAAASSLASGASPIRLGVMARNGRAIVTALGAKGYVGATIYLLNIGSSPEQLLGTLEENQITHLVVDSEFLERLPDNYSRDLDIVIGHVDPADAVPSHLPEELPTLAEVCARDFSAVKLPVFPSHGPIVLMSSGTTGIPKGIIRPEPAFPAVLSTIMSNMPWRADQKVQLTASIFHTWGWACLNIALGARNTIVTRRVFDPVACLEDIERHRLDGLLSSPVFYKQMVEADPTGTYDASSLTFIASSGHALSPQLVQDTIARFGPILANVYGSTELTLAAVANAKQIAADPTIGGKVASGTTMKILDSNGVEVPQGEVGEIFLSNSMTLTGYTKPGMEVERVQGLVSIGDLGYFDADGFLHVLGRADDMIIVGGENVHPQSVTEVLETMPGVHEVYSGGVDDPDTFKRIAVWVVRTKDALGQALTEDSIRAFVDEKLASHSIPRDVHFRDRLPRNPTGKVVPRLL